MRLFRNIAFVLALYAIASCTGNMDDSSVPVLTASDTEIDLATETQAVFTVTYNGADVTDKSEISSTLSTLELNGNVFRPERTGVAMFTAVYDGKTSEPVTVTVVDSEPEPVESAYERHVCVMEFTGAWCINCPEGYDRMRGILAYPQFSSCKDRIHLCAFHSDEEGTDTLAIAATQDVIALFKDMAYPSFATDMRDSGVLTSDGISLFRPSIEASFEEYLPHCGVAVSSALSDDGGQAEVTVKVTSEKTSEYRVIVLVVQDKITGWQKSVNYQSGQDDYLHRHVVRKVVTSYSGTFTGEKMTDDGMIASGEEASRIWNFDVDDRWNLEMMEIYALVLDSDGYVNNMNVCSIDGGDSGYDIK